MAVAARSADPFEEEALRWLPDLLRYAQSLTRDVSDAEDLVQDTYLIAQRSWYQFQHGTDSRARLFTIARLRFYQLHQRAERDVPTDAPELESLAMAKYTREQQHSIADSFGRDAIRQVIRTSMHALPDAFREVAILADWHDLTYETVARILDVPIGTVRSRLFRARRLLQQALPVHGEDQVLRPTRADAPERL